MTTRQRNKMRFIWITFLFVVCIALPTQFYCLVLRPMFGVFDEWKAGPSLRPVAECFGDQVGLLWWVAAANIVICLVKLILPGLHFWAAWKNRNTVLSKPNLYVMIGYGAMALSMGLTQGMYIVVLWKPYYWTLGLMLQFSAFISVMVMVMAFTFRKTFIDYVGLEEILIQNKALQTKALEVDRVRKLLERPPLPNADEEVRMHMEITNRLSVLEAELQQAQFALIENLKKQGLDPNAALTVV